MWTMIRKMIPASDKVSVTPIKNQDGTTAHSEEEILEAWAAHQEALGTPQDNPQWNEVFAREIEAKLDAINSEEGGDLDHDFDSLEVQEAVDALNYHKAAAEDGTKNPMYKCGGEFMVELLVKLFNFLKMKEMTPENWSRSVVVNLYKDGDRTDPSNYRGIALISCLGKLYLSLWARRITNYMESRLSEEQGGFRPRRSTVDQALTLREALLHRHRQGVPTYLYFVDFKKAFDTVWLDWLWARLHEEGIRGKALRIIMNLYNHVCSQVRVGDKFTKEVCMIQGVRQGCPLSPALFNIFIDELARRINAAEPDDAGVQIGEQLLRCRPLR